MAKSIESIWKKGFISKEQLDVPKVNNLYSRKSQNIVDKLHDMFATNIKAIIIGSLIMLVVFSLVGAPFLGIYICVLLTPLVIIANSRLKQSIGLAKGDSSYKYLKSFNSWLKESIEVYSKYYRVFYPLFFLGMAIQGIVSKAGGNVISLMLQLWPTDFLILQQPYYLIVAIAVVTLIFAKLSDAIYRWDLNIIYGRQFKKLDEIIEDMEELRR